MCISCESGSYLNDLTALDSTAVCPSGMLGVGTLLQRESRPCTDSGWERQASTVDSRRPFAACHPIVAIPLFLIGRYQRTRKPASFSKAQSEFALKLLPFVQQVD